MEISHVSIIILFPCFILPLELTSRTNLTLKHQVEFLGFRKLVARFRRANVVLFDDLSKLGTTIVVNLYPTMSMIFVHIHPITHTTHTNILEPRFPHKPCVLPQAIRQQQRCPFSSFSYRIFGQW